MILKKPKKEVKTDNFVYKKTDDIHHNLELIKRIINDKNKRSEFNSNIEIFDTLSKYGFNVRYFNLDEIIGRINYGFCIVDLDIENKYLLVDINYYKLYLSKIINEPIIENLDGIKFVNKLSIYGFTNVNDKTFNMYLNTFDNLKEKIEINNLYKQKTYRR